MNGTIEKMNRMRRNILFGVLDGTGLVFCLFMFPALNRIFRLAPRWTWREIERIMDGALLLWLVTILLSMTRYMLYKLKLKKDRSLFAAVNDERVQWDWLRAYRFAFIVVLGLTVFWKWYETGLYPDAGRIFPDPPWLIAFGAVISLVGSFLWFNREGREEKRL